MFLLIVSLGAGAQNTSFNQLAIELQFARAINDK
jgi:hypothetical protein